MLELFMKENGVYYVLLMLCAVGVAGKCYESRIYSRLLEAAENPERTGHPFLKQLKMKYRNCYQLERQIHNTDAFVESYLYRYKYRHTELSRLHSVTVRVMLLCMLVSFGGAGACVYYGLGTAKLIYHILAGSMAVLVLEFAEQQSGIESRRRRLRVSLTDYLENGLSNQLVNRNRDENRPYEGTFVSESSNRNPSQEKDAGEEREYTDLLQNQAGQQMAVTETIAEKVASELTSEKVIVDVIEEFFT